VSDALKPSAARVQDYLARQGQEFVVCELPGSTRSAEEAAQAIGCEVGQIAKSLVFMDKNTGEPVLVIASGAHRVDTGKIHQQTGMRLTRADADFVRQHTGFAIGGIPPVAHTAPIGTMLDQALQQYDQIWAAAGTPNAVFKLTPVQLAELTNGKWIALAG
jgi:prolyl-tRNA editing enzyme YbaK/EbsC (Cys-tRNA(Pro) deacylase)